MSTGIPSPLRPLGLSTCMFMTIWNVNKMKFTMNVVFWRILRYMIKLPNPMNRPICGSYPFILCLWVQIGCWQRILPGCFYVSYRSVIIATS